MTSPLATLHDEQATIGSLIDVMQQEQQFLVSADSDGLDQITPQKSALVQQAASLASQRHQALGSAGFAASENGMAAWLAEASAEARAQWTSLLNRTRAAKELNRVNGLLINKQLSHAQQALNAMRTPANGGEPGFYGPSGQTTAGGPSRRYVIG
jgi:flagellar biosynthesis protein FlgN